MSWFEGIKNMNWSESAKDALQKTKNVNWSESAKDALQKIKNVNWSESVKDLLGRTKNVNWFESENDLLERIKSVNWSESLKILLKTAKSTYWYESARNLSRYVIGAAIENVWVVIGVAVVAGVVVHIWRSGGGGGSIGGKIMKAPGGNGRTMYRSVFEGNPRGYFCDLRNK